MFAPADRPNVDHSQARESLQTVADKLAEMLQASHIRRGPKHIRVAVGEMQQAVIDVESYLESSVPHVRAAD